MLSKCPLWKELTVEVQNKIKKLRNFLVENNKFDKKQAMIQIKLLYTTSKNIDQVERLIYGHYTEILFENFCRKNQISCEWNNGSNSTSIYTGYYLDKNNYLRINNDSNELRGEKMLSSDFKIQNKNKKYLIDIKYTDQKNFWRGDEGKCFPRSSCSYLKIDPLIQYYDQYKQNNYNGVWIQLNVINEENPFNIVKTVFIDIEETFNELEDKQSIKVKSCKVKGLEFIIFNLKECYSPKEFLEIINN